MCGWFGLEQEEAEEGGESQVAPLCGRAQEQVPGWVPHWEVWGGMLRSFPKREAKNTSWWPLAFGVAHQLSALGRRAMLKGESGLVQAIHCGSLVVGHDQLVLIPLF